MEKVHAVHIPNNTNRFELFVPSSIKFLCVKACAGEPMLFAQYDEHAPHVNIQIAVLKNGDPVPCGAEHIDTFVANTVVDKGEGKDVISVPFHIYRCSVPIVRTLKH